MNFYAYHQALKFMYFVPPFLQSLCLSCDRFGTKLMDRQFPSAGEHYESCGRQYEISKEQARLIAILKHPNVVIRYSSHAKDEMATDQINHADVMRVLTGGHVT